MPFNLFALTSLFCDKEEKWAKEGMHDLFMMPQKSLNKLNQDFLKPAPNVLSVLFCCFVPCR